MIFLQMFQKLYCSFKATIIDIQNTEQPLYNAYKNCNKKAFMRGEIGECVKCCNPTVDHYPRYMLFKSSSNL